MGARNQVGVGLSFRPNDYIYRLAELIPRSRFLGSLKILNIRALYDINSFCPNYVQEFGLRTRCLYTCWLDNVDSFLVR